MSKYRVDLENFEGPFDLLLYLIKRDEIDVYDIPISRITDQYMDYVDNIEEMNLDNAGEFIVMASTLMYIKSKMLLPIETVSIEDELDRDPRDELVAKLLEYKKYKEIASKLHNKEIQQKKYYACKISPPKVEKSEDFFEASLYDLVNAFNKIYQAGSFEKVYEINPIIYRVEEKIDLIIALLKEKKDINFLTLFEKCSRRLEIVVTFLAILELIKQKHIVAWQSKLFGEIWFSRYPDENQKQLDIAVQQQ